MNGRHFRGAVYTYYLEHSAISSILSARLRDQELAIYPWQFRGLGIIYEWPTNHQVGDAETLNSAGAEYTRNSVKQMLRAFEQVKQLRADKAFGENACRTVLAGHIVALSDTVDWVAAQRKSDFNKNIYADEEGRFKITGIPEGRYTLVVSGQAGLYNAFWEKEEVVITAGQTTEVKLSSPTKSCLTQ